ncbi:MAG: oxidoreductase [Acidimicrobiia bacterium]
MSAVEPLRIGILGAARIAPRAVIGSARALPDVEVVAVASRDRRRGERFARRYGVPTVHESYAALLADARVDAVYVGLPNGLHGAWTAAAVRAGKHVLCEKPFAANAQEAAAVAEVAEGSSVVVMEAFHWRYHPLAELVRTLVADERVGRVQHLEARAVVPYLKPGDIRFDLSLAGGSLMDIGCYAVHQLRVVAGDEPRVVSARAKCKAPGVDRWIEAQLRWPDGRTGRIEAALWSFGAPMIDLRVKGDLGMLKVLNPIAPHVYNRVTLKDTDLPAHVGRKRQRIEGESSYQCQLRAFTAAVRDGGPVLTPPADAVRTLRVIDAIYEAAGMLPRLPTPVEVGR